LSESEGKIRLAFLFKTSFVNFSFHPSSLLSLMIFLLFINKPQRGEKVEGGYKQKVNIKGRRKAIQKD